MSSNYYAVVAGSPCPHCGHDADAKRLHIGKALVGWTFALHVEPDDPDHPASWTEWLVLICRPGVSILNEYGETVTPAEMRARVMNRAPREPAPQSWLDENHAIIGPRGLARRRIDGEHCIGHGEGTWDLVRGEFS